MSLDKPLHCGYTAEEWCAMTGATVVKYLNSSNKAVASWLEDLEAWNARVQEVRKHYPSLP